MKIIRPPLFMRPTPESELEQTLDRELRALPDCEAPASLMPRVLNAIAARERLPWWCKPYAYWPGPARAVFLTLTTSLAALFLYFTWGVSSGATLAALTDEVSEIVSRLEVARSLVSAFGNVGAALVRAAGPTMLWVAAGVATACYVTTLTLGTYFYRLVSQRI